MNIDTFVYKDGAFSCHLNKNLIIKQELGERSVAKLKDLHRERLFWEKKILKVNSDVAKRVIMSIWTDIQFDLQETWGFEKNQKFHKFWEMKGCSCPRMDNDDNYPHGYYVTNLGCKVHGASFK